MNKYRLSCIPSSYLITYLISPYKSNLLLRLCSVSLDCMEPFRISVEKQDGKKFAWVIKNLSSLQLETCYCDPVKIGDCKWRLSAISNYNKDNCLTFFLEVTDFESLPCGWRRHVRFRLSVVKEKGEQSVLKECFHWFDQKSLVLIFLSKISVAKLRDVNKGFLVNGELTFVAYLDIHEVIGTTEKSVETNPLKKLKVESASSMSETRQDLAVEFRAKNQHLKTSCMDYLFSISQMLFQKPQELSADDLVEADNALAYIKNSGVNVDWLEKKLEEVKEMKKDEEST